MKRLEVCLTPLRCTCSAKQWRSWGLGFSDSPKPGRSCPTRAAKDFPCTGRLLGTGVRTAEPQPPAQSSPWGYSSPYVAEAHSAPKPLDQQPFPCVAVTLGIHHDKSKGPQGLSGVRNVIEIHLFFIYFFFFNEVQENNSDIFQNWETSAHQLIGLHPALNVKAVVVVNLVTRAQTPFTGTAPDSGLSRADKHCISIDFAGRTALSRGSQPQ